MVVVVESEVGRLAELARSPNSSLSHTLSAIYAALLGG